MLNNYAAIIVLILPLHLHNVLKEKNKMETGGGWRGVRFWAE